MSPEQTQLSGVDVDTSSGAYRIISGQSFDRFIDLQKVLRRGVHRKADIIKIDPPSVASSLQPPPVTRAIDQNSPHRLRRCCEEMAPRIPFLLDVATQ